MTKLKPKVQCKECKKWHEDLNQDYCTPCIAVFKELYLAGHYGELCSNNKDINCNNLRRQGSAYCQECSDEHNNKLINNNGNS